LSKILLVEDDPRVAGFVRRGLEAEGYAVDHARTGEDALELAGRTPYRLVILDRMLPGIDGIEVCRRLRAQKYDAGILMLTAKDAVRDRVEGLKTGADDYLTKPFAFDELIARIEALLRRSPQAAPDPTLRVGDLVLDPDMKQVRRGGREVVLTAKEFTLLTYLMENAGTVISRQRLLSNIWGLSFDPNTKVVDVYIRYLRQKIEGEGEPPLIKTVRGFGYMLIDSTGASKTAGEDAP
jgi:two-component system OmpR family response regulator